MSKLKICNNIQSICKMARLQFVDICSTECMLTTVTTRVGLVHFRPIWLPSSLHDYQSITLHETLPTLLLVLINSTKARRFSGVAFTVLAHLEMVAFWNDRSPPKNNVSPFNSALFLGDNHVISTTWEFSKNDSPTGRYFIWKQLGILCISLTSWETPKFPSSNTCLKEGEALALKWLPSKTSSQTPRASWNPRNAKCENLRTNIWRKFALLRLYSYV